ncbi:SGNH/GDSL hydrolase family protein [Spiroplasma turonicum]|uniref:Lipolytic enzyme, GDSL family n=1 Tax=Spiroplasma turonicum TaxID=216946 RepID=A0A0K1P5Y6_9MOLU|nr:SGNH/GDSL hydrolase family protein [Spiroplasma turonicum]AKU79675.1 hypothetical protein STURON_00429 [Spiroplasma turonicum]ALX70695.1 lipolytic enzyme [Spiroplasma turonicum]
MKKILSIISSLSLCINISSTIIACTNDTKEIIYKIPELNNFYVLGDSLSDAGGYKYIAQALIDKNSNKGYKFDFRGNFKTEDAIRNQFPSYSNGITTVEWLNSYFGFDGPMKTAGELLVGKDNQNGRNYAVGGARAWDDITLTLREANINKTKMKVDILSQANALVSQKKLTENDLVLVEIGGNDMMDVLLSLADSSLPKKDEIIRKSSENIYLALNTVLSTGANVLFMNSPDLRQLPTVKGGELDRYGKVTALSNAAPSLVNLLHTYDDEYHQKTDEVISNLKEVYNYKIFQYDLYHNFKNIITNYSELYSKTFNKSLNIVNNFGVDGTYFKSDEKLFYMQNSNVKGHETNEIDNYFFIDQVHPTRYVHQYVAKTIYNFICDSFFKIRQKMEIKLDLIN